MLDWSKLKFWPIKHLNSTNQKSQIKSVCKFYSLAYCPSNYVLCHLFYTIKETLYEKINTKYPNTIAFQAKWWTGDWTQASWIALNTCHGNYGWFTEVQELSSVQEGCNLKIGESLC